MTKHTPGKLVVNGKQSIRGERGEYIAKANWRNGPANAARIVHTLNCHDDLVEALEQALVALTYSSPHADYPEAQDRHVTAIAEAGCALAKAKGE